MTSKYYTLLSSLFVALLIVSNVIAVKIGSFGGYFLPVAVVVFPVSYIFSDVITEVYGFAAMRRVIWTGFLGNLIVVLAIALAIAILAAPFFEGQDAFMQVLGSTPRILVASFAAYLVGEFANAIILAKMKVSMKGKLLPVRTIISTIIGEGLDSAIFITLAFWGGFPPAVVGMMILTQWAFKVLFETLATPFTYALVQYLKKTESIDHYDTHTRFNPLAI